MRAAYAKDVSRVLDAIMSLVNHMATDGIATHLALQPLAPDLIQSTKVAIFSLR